jgi:hypothetical protein
VVYVIRLCSVIVVPCVEQIKLSQVHPAEPVNTIEVPNIVSVVALNGELICSMPADKISELIVDSVDNEPDSEYTKVELVVLY